MHVCTCTVRAGCRGQAAAALPLVPGEKKTSRVSQNPSSLSSSSTKLLSLHVLVRRVSRTSPGSKRFVYLQASCAAIALVRVTLAVTLKEAVTSVGIVADLGLSFIRFEGGFFSDCGWPMNHRASGFPICTRIRSEVTLQMVKKMASLCRSCFLLAFVLFVAGESRSESSPNDVYQVTVDLSDVVAPLKRFWRSTGFCPPLPHENFRNYVLTDDEVQNLALIGSVARQGIKQVRIHWLFDLVKVTGYAALNLCLLKVHGICNVGTQS